MSLNPRQRADTRAELRANLERSGLAVSDIAAGLGREPAEVADAIAVGPGCNPALVWAVRDALEVAVESRGLIPVPFSTLTEAARKSAQIWFGVEPPRRE
ncbi:MAG: DUF2316 family protein [Candidatus Nanopelagicales bacterium]